ncbi:HutD family protein [Leisingera daeponensis]|uniref:HutD/Ves family protein n=1 Tax=Leisingera daeponensis TaxID=405746 RepID=UPI001C93FB00|nr:HutD family protein [Leisingera daeponensis]MBY6059027.1 HutD family protein [Leisingera daeponensis]
MTITYLPAAGYETLPWKNGEGFTDEICLRPDGASREDFALRISSAPILESGVFSAFPGAERVITLIEGSALDLRFATHTHRLLPFRPYFFDTGLAPVGTPDGGPVRVVNVMAARAAWKVAGADLLSAPALCDAGENGLIVLFAVSGEWHLRKADGTLALAPRDSALLEGAQPVPVEGAGQMLAVQMQRAG